MTAPTPAAPNALHTLRSRFGVQLDAVARALGIPASEVEALERTPLARLELGTVDRYVGAVGCRLDVVAVHLDGEAVWLGET